ncbi:unnamed protein product [Ascophyllum nodosum]
MVDVCNKKCRTEGCVKQPSFGVAGTKTVEYCAQHAPYGMVNVCIRKYRTQGCSKKPLFGVANTITTQYSAQHARRKCGIEEYREREIDPQHSGKETIGNVTPSGASATTFRRPPTKASLPSGGSRNSRKRVRHPEITCTASKGAVARESTEGTVTILGIDGRKSPVQRDSSVKTEVQLSL